VEDSYRICPRRSQRIGLRVPLKAETAERCKRCEHARSDKIMENNDAQAA